MLTTRVAKNEKKEAKRRTRIAGRTLLRICSVTVSFWRSSSAELAEMTRMGMAYWPTSRGVKVSAIAACSPAGIVRAPVAGAADCDGDPAPGDADVKKSDTG